MEKSPFEELAVAQVLKKFPALYETRKFISPLVPVLSQMNVMHNLLAIPLRST
jgi:hypothetical protein